MTASNEGQVKVRFALEQDQDGWPPVQSEGVWARPLGDDEYQLDNVPWFARGAAYGDRFRTRADEAGVLWVESKTEWSGRYTIRVIPLGDGSSSDQCREVIDAFSPLGAECEGALPAFKIVALDIPPTARLSEIKRLLRAGDAEGRWGYDEGCIDDCWAAL